MKMIVWFGVVLCVLSAAGKVFISEIGKKVTLECGVNSYRNKLLWYKGSEMVRQVNIIRHVPTKGEGKGEIVGRSQIKFTKLEITDVKETDAGEFRCEADGKTFNQKLVVVSVSVDPSHDLEVGGAATLNCLVKDVDQDFTVEWKKPDGLVIREQTLQLKPLVISDGGTWQCMVTHPEVTFDTTRTLTVKDHAAKPTTPFFNQNSKNSDNRPDQPDPPSHTVKLFGLDWWVWAALGAGCLLLILLIIFIIIMCKRIKRKKKKLMKKRAQQSQKSKKYCQCVRQTAASKPQQGRRREQPSAPTLQLLQMQ